jgi:hypothetical protein
VSYRDHRTPNREPGVRIVSNLALLFREQHDMIDRCYVRMREHSGSEAFTYAITVAGRPSIPGARPFPSVFPLQ